MAKISAKKLLSLCRKKSILLLTHENADLDAFCSAAIMQRFLKKNKINSFIGIPHHINEQALGLALKEKIAFYLNPNLAVFNLVMLFDFNHFEQLGKLRKNFEELLACGCFRVVTFDHHEAEKKNIARGAFAVIDADAVSATEVLSNFLDQVKPREVLRVPRNQRFRLGKYSDKEMHFLNCVGILEDTGRFLVGNGRSFSSFSNSLSKSGRTYAEMLAVARHSFAEDERIAFLKAAQRAQIVEIKGVVVVLSELSFYQGPAATKLLDFGAHISLVCGKEKDGLTVLSARAESEFKEKRKFNLMPHLLVPLQEKIGGSAGGHSGAAQWKGNAGPKVVLGECISILKKKFE